MSYMCKVSLFSICWFVFGCLNISVGSESEFTYSQRTEVEKSGAVRWFIETSTGFNFEMVQRHPSQSIAFYTARGFSEDIIKHYANTCIFHTSLANNSDKKSFEINLLEWNVIPSNHEPQSGLLSTDYWLDRWEKYEVRKPAQIAFKFSQLPTIQHPSPGDWFQGMISLPLEKSDTFNLELVWHENNIKRYVLIENLNCNTSKVEP